MAVSIVKTIASRVIRTGREVGRAAARGVKPYYHSRPSFLIVGAQKAGTSSLHAMLDRHSLLVGTAVKEVHYFDNDAWYASEGSEAEYHKHFPLPLSMPAGGMTYETTPRYLYHPDAAVRIHDYRPDMKIIILLRDPASRAFSGWTMYHHHFATGRNNHLHDALGFGDAVAQEIDALGTTNHDSDRQSYVKRGFYADQVERYIDRFGRDRMLILESSRLRNEWHESLARICDFLQVPYEEIEPLNRNSSKANDKVEYRSELAELREFYRPHNARLFDLIGETYAWD